jgi:hypothetical protein
MYIFALYVLYGEFQYISSVKHGILSFNVYLLLYVMQT